jgi:hypothetical protein
MYSRPGEKTDTICSCNSEPHSVGRAPSPMRDFGLIASRIDVGVIPRRAFHRLRYPNDVWLADAPPGLAGGGFFRVARKRNLHANAVQVGDDAVTRCSRGAHTYVGR